MKKCKKCKHFELLEGYFCSDPWHASAGECGNPEIYDDSNDNSLVRAGGSDGDGDYFYVSADFGCIKFEEK